MSLVTPTIIFSTTIEYGTSSSSIDSSELFNWIFSNLIRGWLVGATVFKITQQHFQFNRSSLID